jgi:hypothetical protein
MKRTDSITNVEMGTRQKTQKFKFFAALSGLVTVVLCGNLLLRPFGVSFTDLFKRPTGFHGKVVVDPFDWKKVNGVCLKVVLL